MRLPRVILAIPLILLFAGAAMACPNCKEAIEVLPDQAAKSSLSAGYNLSIYAMLGGLLLAIGIMAKVIVTAVRTTPSSAPPDRI